MACSDDDENVGCFFTMFILLIGMIILACLYTDPSLPKLSIEDFSVPAFNKTSDQTPGDIYFDLKLRNMNRAIGLYYDDPFNLAFSYYPIDQPYQKYVWEYTVPAFYQGNGKTKHIRTLVGNHLRPPSTVVIKEEEDSQESDKHARSLLMRNHHLQLPSNSSVVDGEDQELNYSPATAAEVVSFRVDLILNYRFKFFADPYTHVLEVGGDVVVDANSGERVSKGSIFLVESPAAAAGGGPVLAVVLFTSFLLMSM